MRLKPFLCCSSLLVLLALPALAEPLAPRGEVSVKGGMDRSLLTTEFWAPLAQQSDRVLYGDIRLMGDNDENREGNLGLGYRQIKNDAVIGIHGWIDRRRTQHNSTFHQLTFGLEHLGHIIDTRANVYIPINNGRNITTRNIGVTSPYLAGSGIYYDTNGSISETPQYGVDGELGYRIPVFKKQIDAIRVYGGGYYFFRDNTVEVPGTRFRTEAQINKIFSVGVRLQYDKPRGTQGFLEATLKFPLSAKRLYQESGIRARLDESPERDIDIVTDSKVIDTGLKKPILNTSSGAQQRILYVDNSKADNGDGSYEKPFNTLKSAEIALQANDILYINRGDGTARNMDHGLIIDKPNVHLIGSGSNFFYDGENFSTQNGVNYSGVILQAASVAPIITNVEANVIDTVNNIHLGNGILINADNISISGLTVTDATGSGIYAITPNSVAMWQSVKISEVTAKSNNRYGIVIQTLGGTIRNVEIKNSSANSNINRAGIAVFSEANGLIGNALIQGNTSSDNSILSSTFGGIAAHATTGGTIGEVVIDRNTVSGNNSHGIYANAQSNAKFNSIQISNNKSFSSINGNGIAITSSNSMISSISVQGNSSNNNLGVNSSGISILSNSNGIVAHTDIKENTANNNTISGITLQSGTGGTISGAILNNNTTNQNIGHGLYLYSVSATSVVSNTSISFNNFTGNTGNGVYIRKGNVAAILQADLGGGAFASAGQNRIFGNTSNDLNIDRATISAGLNWWNNAGAAPTRVTLSNGGSATYTTPLATDPRP